MPNRRQLPCKRHTVRELIVRGGRNAHALVDLPQGGACLRDSRRNLRMVCRASFACVFELELCGFAQLGLVGLRFNEHKPGVPSISQLIAMSIWRVGTFGMRQPP